MTFGKLLNKITILTISRTNLTKMNSSFQHWSHGLIDAMKNPDLQFIKNDKCVVIKDCYAKSKYHFLVMPWDDIADQYSLSNDDLDLLDEIELLAKNIVEILGLPKEHFRMGYHAEPHMQRLHLHVISQDFDSDRLKNKKHWNSFTTEYFMNMKDVHNEIRQNGSVKKPDNSKCEELLKKDLICHKCSYKPKHLPDLKKHINSKHKIF